MEVIEDRPFNDNRYFINSDKLKSLGWKQNNDENVLYSFIKDFS
jgi:dTDP-D-glucose 4,6-dehydratase